MKTIPAKVKNLAAKLLCQAVSNTYYPKIPLREIFDAIETAGLVPVMEDNTRWEGFLCGSDGRLFVRLAAKESANGLFFEPSENAGLAVCWHKMGSGKFEIISYVS